jgi:signal transduction histidine kinase
MIGSLYLRVVLTFLLAVILGLVITFFSTNYWYKSTIEEEIQTDMNYVAHDIIETFQQMNGVDIDSYLKDKHSLRYYHLTLIDANGKRAIYGNPTIDEANNGELEIPQQAIDMVMQNKDYHNQAEGFRYLVGFPMKVGEQQYALFIQPALTKEFQNLRKMLLTSLLSVLFVGSLCILIAARYLVHPLKQMTKATRLIAKGDFNINFNMKHRNDELGELAKSFRHMAIELGQIERMREDFVSNVSHEIQSPLTSISGFSKLIRNKSMTEEERNQYVDIIQTESDRLSRLSENLLKLTSLQSEHHPFHPTTFDLDEQLRKVAVALEPQWSMKDLELILDLPKVRITADADQLYQVWINLLSNATKFTPSGGWIQVKLELMTDRVCMRIRDSGVGIKEEDKERIFERFYMVDKARQRELGSSGLGLAIVKKIVELHQGAIAVESEVGAWTEFTVTLPSVLYSVKK